MTGIVKNLENLKKSLLNRVGLSPDSRAEVLTSAVKSLRVKQLLLLSTGAALVLLGGLYIFLSGDESVSSSKGAKPTQKAVNTLATPLSPVDERETWVNRVEKKAESVRQEAAQVRQENQVLIKRVDVLEELFKARPSAQPISPSSISTNEEAKSTIPASSSELTNHGANPQPSQDAPSPQRFPPIHSSHGTSPYGTETSNMQNVPSNQGSNHSSPKKRGAKIIHLTGQKLSGTSLKSPDTYLPAGTYCKAVVDMGVAASTATNAQGNPEPIKLRLVDDGNLPGGLKGQVRDAVLIGACYGDISSERARCRLETLTWKDKNGIQIEKTIEGWVVGEDGLAGLRGKVVDRSGDVAREAFGAGLLSAAANFLKFEPTAGVSPMMPFGMPSGQSNALSKGNALKGAAASGAGNALDKLAEFSIKRAEQMQPVILVASGRVVDVLLKSGVSLTPDSDTDMKVVGASSPNTNTDTSTPESQEG